MYLNGLALYIHTLMDASRDAQSWMLTWLVIGVWDSSVGPVLKLPGSKT